MEVADELHLSVSRRWRTQADGRGAVRWRSARSGARVVARGVGEVRAVAGQGSSVPCGGWPGHCRMGRGRRPGQQRAERGDVGAGRGRRRCGRFVGADAGSEGKGRQGESGSFF